MAAKHAVRAIASVVLDDPKFPKWSGASKPTTHHYGYGGLCQHVWEVCQLCERTNDFFTTIDKAVDGKLLFLAALFHDVGKLWDYEPVPYILGDIDKYRDWRATDHKHKIHHISRSAMIWYRTTEGITFTNAERDEVAHAILAHHGQREWGSPVTPQTRMAWILHNCDQLSARVDDCDKKGKK